MTKRLSHAKLLTLAGALALLAGCSSKGGKAGAEQADQKAAPMTVALITHAAPGDTFWDLVRLGAEAAAASNNVSLRYVGDPDGGAQVTLVQNALDSKIDAIAITLAKPSAMAPAVRLAVERGTPVVALNAGIDAWQPLGVTSYFGSDDGTAGEAAGQRAAKDGAKHVLCVAHEQGHVALEARCDGLSRGFTPGRFEKVYVMGTDMPSVRSTIAAKLKQDPSIDLVVTLGAPFAVTARDSVRDLGSKAKVATFDLNEQIPAMIRNGSLEWAIDQQPFLQGYMAVTALSLQHRTGNIIGGGKPVLTGPFFVDRSNVDKLGSAAARAKH
ncbi:substrate-binding domain-containing protein [Sphingomonas sp.]|jgi:simple sugar transport system substrate-binding protein|uniref:substrate-binding domain-containing protein n=1 Tax=Sphingomonas sp. TaxID=28214 RepID=UPI002ED7E964